MGKERLLRWSMENGDFNMYQEKDSTTHIEEDDQCYTCSYFRDGVDCPLLEALSEHIVYLDGPIRVCNCGFYIEYKRKLEIVKDDIS